MRQHIALWGCVVVLALVPVTAWAQLDTGECLGGGCNNFNRNFPTGTLSTTSNAFVTVSTSINAGDYAYYSVTQGYTYEWSTCSADGASATYDTQLTLWNQGGTTAYCYSDDYCTNASGLNRASKIMWTASFSGTVRVLVSQYSCTNNTTATTLRWRCASCGTPPANDNCASATAVGEVYNVAFNTTYATYDGSGTCTSTSAGNIWYCYTASCTGVATISLLGSSYDTILAVYSSCSCATGMPSRQLACNDDYGGTLQSQVTINTLAGSQYLIEVGGYGSNAGAGVLTISGCANDLCANATFVGNVVNLPFDTRCANHDGDGTCTSTSAGNVWFCYTATGWSAKFDTCGSTFDTKMAVYDGCNCAAGLPNRQLACNDDSVCNGVSTVQSTITLNTIPGHMYLVEVGGYGSYEGAGDLTITAAGWNYDVNKDLRNTGTRTAYDLTVVLQGSETVVGHYDGYSVRRFTSFTTSTSGGNTVLRWSSVSEPGGNNAIDPNEVVHIGWSTQDHSSNVRDMYWTDQNGYRLAGSKIYNITTNRTYFLGDQGMMTLMWENIFSTESGETAPIDIMATSWALFSSPLLLEELNAENMSLNEILDTQPLPEGTFNVPPHEVVTRELPVSVTDGTAIVLRYHVTGPGSEADAIDYVQFVVTAHTPLGACCYLDYSCVLTPQADCDGQWLGAGTTCAQCAPCVVCPTGGIPEGEPRCADEYVDTHNGGCNSDPYVFQPIACGQTICGEAGTYLFGGSQYRDTDWYEVTVNGTGTLFWTVQAEFPLATYILDGNNGCDNPNIVIASGTANRCEVLTISATVTTGTYWLWVGTNTFSGVVCGTPYIATLTCEGFEQTGACCLSTGQCIDNVTESTCAEMAGTFWPNVTCGVVMEPGYPIEWWPNRSISPGTLEDARDVFLSTPVGRLRIDVWIQYWNLGEIELWLGHEGVWVPLWMGACSGYTDMDVVFDDAAAAVLCASPVTGDVSPMSCGGSRLATFRGMEAGGTWVLRVINHGSAGGLLIRWSFYVQFLDQDPCRPIRTGACCLPSGACVHMAESECAAAGGIFYYAVPCPFVECPQPPLGVCCYEDGTCTVVTQYNCLPPGEWHPEWTSCDANPCVDLLGACCYGEPPDWSCVYTFERVCTTQYAGTFYADADCTDQFPPGGDGIADICEAFVCCLPDGTCVAITDCAECMSTFHGECFHSDSCDPPPCPPPTGACCFRNGSCQVLTEADCMAAGGVHWMGAGTTCEPNPCICRGDGNCDGRVNFADIDLFVAAIPDNRTAWAALFQVRYGHPPTCPFLNNDCNGDGHVNFSDIDPFVALIPSVCP